MTEETKEPTKVKKTVKKTVKPKVVQETSGSDIIERTAVVKSNEEAASEMRELLTQESALTLAETAIRDNQIEFEVDGVSYRVRKSNYKEKQDANQFRMKRFVELLRDPDVLLEKDLKQLYLKKGIDIDSIDKQVLGLDKQQKVLMLDLGKAIKNNKSKPELQQYKEEILQIASSIQMLNQEKQQYLEFSLENRILMELYSYVIWLIAEKQVGDKWVRIWNKYEDFLATDNNKLLQEVTKLGAIVVTDDMSQNIKV